MCLIILYINNIKKNYLRDKLLSFEFMLCRGLFIDLMSVSSIALDVAIPFDVETQLMIEADRLHACNMYLLISVGCLS